MAEEVYFSCPQRHLGSIGNEISRLLSSSTQSNTLWQRSVSLDLMTYSPKVNTRYLSSAEIWGAEGLAQHSTHNLSWALSLLAPTQCFTKLKCPSLLDYSSLPVIEPWSSPLSIFMAKKSSLNCVLILKTEGWLSSAVYSSLIIYGQKQHAHFKRSWNSQELQSHANVGHKCVEKTVLHGECHGEGSVCAWVERTLYWTKLISYVPCCCGKSILREEGFVLAYSCRGYNPSTAGAGGQSWCISTQKAERNECQGPASFLLLWSLGNGTCFPTSSNPIKVNPPWHAQRFIFKVILSHIKSTVNISRHAKSVSHLSVCLYYLFCLSLLGIALPLSLPSLFPSFLSVSVSPFSFSLTCSQR